MRLILLTGFTTLLLLWQSSSISSGQTGLPLVPTTETAIRVLKKESVANKDTIATLLKKVEEKVDSDNRKKAAIRYRYIHVKYKPAPCTDTVWLALPKDSIDRIIHDTLSKLKKDTIYLPLPEPAKKRSWWDRMF